MSIIITRVMSESVNHESVVIEKVLVTTRVMVIESVSHESGG